MRGRDEERIKRLCSALDQAGIDIFIGSGPYMRYILGSDVDYAYAYATRGGEVGVLCSLLEMERARDATWADRVFAFTGLKEPTGEDIIKARSLQEAVPGLIERVIGPKGVVGIDYTVVSFSEASALRRRLRGYRVRNVHRLLREVRAVKSPAELEAIKRAVRIVSEGISHGIMMVREGVSEREIYLESEYFMKSIGADRVHEFLIVASGPNSAYPHGRPTERKLSPGDPVTLDYVASSNGYFADLTRTVFLKPVGQELRRIYEVVEEALGAGIDAVADGVEASEVDRVVRERIAKSGYGRYFIHSTGHGIGLEVHEHPRISSAEKAVLKAGMVVTIEPGIYVKGLGGVRIEEDVVVEKGGARVLSSGLSRELLILG
ncbi:hypothetical protein B6U99_00425 [Candidatus Geothermarchaeota archaeon ex4572_27]|nr:MAG: hypothetical protein B6U99_00425 [Candidatus Geothermarchaeota archaeon ex4572_27]